MNMMWIVISAAAVLSAAALATAWAQSKIGAAGAATLAEKPELAGTIIVLLAIPETMVILGFIVAVLILLRAGGG
jgi:V/A-type H+/Na+-transporting ATPase subunit K